MLFHHSIILWNFRRNWKLPNRLVTPVLEWMESPRCCHLKVKSNYRFHRDFPAHTVFLLVPMKNIKNAKTPWTVYQLAITGWFHSGWWGIIRHEVNIPSVFWLVGTGVEILMGEIHIFPMQQSHQGEISSIGYLIDDSHECLCFSGHCDLNEWVKSWCRDWLPHTWSCLDLLKVAGHWIQSPHGSHCHPSLTIPGLFFWAIFTNSSRVFLHKIDSSNPRTTCSVINFHIIATATEVNILPWPISSATSAPGISESHTYLLTMKHIVQTWCMRNLVPGWLGLEHIVTESRSGLDWWMGQAFSNLTTSSRHSGSN